MDRNRQLASDGNDGKFSRLPLNRRKRQEEDDDLSAMKPESGSASSRRRQELGQEDRKPSAVKGKLDVKKSGPGFQFLEQARKKNVDVEIPLPTTGTVQYATVPGGPVSGEECSEITMERFDAPTFRPTLRPIRSQVEPIEVPVASDDAEVVARTTTDGEATQPQEERLMNVKDIVVATEVKEVDPSSHICGLERRAFIIVLIIFAVITMIGGVTSAVLLSTWDKTDGEDKTAPFTNSPTSAPVMPIQDALLEELRSWIAPTEQDLIPFEDPNSAQSAALEWLHSDPITMSENRTTETVLERYVLAVLFFSTSGRNWIWPYLFDDPTCMWNVWNDKDNTTTGVYCLSDDGTVGWLDLSDNNLRGRLPWEIVLLTNLFYIDFDGNRMSGSIPSRINELSRLETFWALGNDLTGSLPSIFSPVTLSIDLGENSMNGSFPAGWGEAMPNLQYLSIERNSFTGTLPADLGNIIPLDNFNFYGNSFTGSVDQFFCGGFRWELLSADCDEVECPCCTYCCYDGEDECVEMT